MGHVGDAEAGVKAQALVGDELADRLFLDDGHREP